MGILDDAIREHLDLKRKHGARDAELREIEEDAFGSGERPDPFAAGDLFGKAAAPPGETGSEEIPGPATPEPSSPPDGEIGSEEPTRLVEPQASAPPAPPAEPDAAPAPPAPEAAPEPEPPPALAPEPPAAPPEPAAAEAVPPAPAEAPTVGEREPPEPPLPPAAEPPESLSLEELMAEEDEEEGPAALAADPEVPPPPPPEPEPAEPAPEAEVSGEPLEPRSSVPEPPPPPPDPGTEPPGRARGRVHHPTEEHPPPEPGSLDFPALGGAPEPARPEAAPAAEGGEPQLYDFETDEGEFAPPAAAEEDEFEELGPPTDEAPRVDDEEPVPEEHTAIREAAQSRPDTGELEEDEFDLGEDGDEDLLASSPDFLEEEGSTEEDLWFEKGPPQDFDFEDDR